MTRRRFVRVAGSAIALSNFPVAAGIAGAQAPAPASFGGPTPNSQFYVTSYASTPTVDASKWRLKIHGLVTNPIELTYQQVKALPEFRQTLTLECISNPPDGTAISNADWVGTKLRPLLDRAGVRSGAVYAAIRAADGYYTGVPLDEMMREENFLVYLMNGEPLPPDHGFPLRVFIPGKYGMKQPKWLTEIEFVDREFTGYWEARGWSNSAWRKVNSGFFYPHAGEGLFGVLSTAARAKAPVDIYGWALAGPSGVRGVDISTDDGATWHQTEIVSNRARYIWTVWKYRFAPARAGSYRIRVRATDGDGNVQPPSDSQTGSGRSGQARMELEITSVA